MNGFISLYEISACKSLFLIKERKNIANDVIPFWKSVVLTECSRILKRQSETIVTFKYMKDSNFQERYSEVLKQNVQIIYWNKSCFNEKLNFLTFEDKITETKSKFQDYAPRREITPGLPIYFQ